MPHVGSNPTRSATSSFLENSWGDCIPTSCFQWTAPNNTKTAKRPGDGVLITREGPVRIRNAAVLVLLSSVLKIGIRDNSRVKRMDFSKRSQTELFFSSIIDDLRKYKIVAAFSLSPMSWNHDRRYRTYSTDTEIFILLENDDCLVIDYRFIDSLDIQYRKMTGEEKNEYSNVKVIDFI